MLLNDSWTMIDEDRRYSCSIPCSAMQVLLREGVIPDPYYRENEWISTPVSERDFTFEKTFTPEDGLLKADRVLLVFGGIDTLGRVWLNDVLLGETDNMHRTWEYSVRDRLVPGENRLRVELLSPLRRAREMQEQRPLTGSAESFPGYPHIRKGPGGCWRTAGPPISISSGSGAAVSILQIPSMTGAMRTASWSGRISCSPAPPMS